MDSSISGVDSTTGLGTLHAFIVVLFGFLLDTFRLAAVALDTCVVGVCMVCVVMVRPTECMVYVTGNALLSIETREHSPVNWLSMQLNHFSCLHSANDSSMPA